MNDGAPPPPPPPRDDAGYDDDNDDGNVDYDDEPAFIEPGEAVEVADGDGDGDGGADSTDDDGGDAAMDDAGATGSDAGDAEIGGDATESPDMSSLTLRYHSGPAYAVASHLYDGGGGGGGGGATTALLIASGGGDDAAYLHRVPLPAASPVAGAAPSASVPPISSASADAPPVRSTRLSHPHTDTVTAVSFNVPYLSPDATGKASRPLLAAGSYDGTIALYDAFGGELVDTLDGPTDVEFVSWHPKGGTVLLVGSTDGTAWMYHVPTSRCLQVFVGHESSSKSSSGGGGEGEGGVTAGSFTPDGRSAVTAGADGTVRLWAPKTGLCRHVFRLTDRGGGGGGGLTCLAVGGGSDGQLALAGGVDGDAYAVHLSGRKVVATLGHHDAAAADSPRAEDGMDVDGGDGDGGGGGGEGTTASPRSVEAVSFAPAAVDPSWAATGGVDGAVKVWDLSRGSGRLRHACRPPGGGGGAQPGAVTYLSWHASLPLLFASHADGPVRLWDARDGSLLMTLTGGGGGDGAAVNAMAAEFAGTGGGAIGWAVVTTASDDGAVRVFEVDVAGALAARGT